MPFNIRARSQSNAMENRVREGSARLSATRRVVQIRLTPETAEAAAIRLRIPFDNGGILMLPFLREVTQ